MAVFKSHFLGFCRFSLKLFTPIFIRHTVYIFPCFILGNFKPARGSSFLNPSRQTISAETGQIHHIDILHISAGLKMVTKGSEGCCLKLCLFFWFISFKLLICLSPLVVCIRYRQHICHMSSCLLRYIIPVYEHKHAA